MALEGIPSEFQANIDRRNKAGADDTIADWTPARLAKFIQNTIANDPPSLPPSLVGQTVKASRLLVISDRVQISAQALKYIKDNLPP